MQRLNVYFFYEFGQTIKELQRASREGEPLSDLQFPCYNAALWIDLLLTTDSLALQIVRAPLQKLKSRIDSMRQKVRDTLQTEEDGNKESPKLDLLDGYNIREAIREFQAVFAAELATADAYVISKKGIYSTADLIERAENALSATLRPTLPEQAILDFREAGKCLALDLFTGSGFHVLRATDAVLRAYYARFVGKPPKPKARNWGAYTRVLRECIADPNHPLKPDPKTVSLIDQIREMHRNPIIHPEDNLDEDKALVLFDVCKSAIVAMAVELKEATPTLPMHFSELMLGKSETPAGTKLLTSDLQGEKQ